MSQPVAFVTGAARGIGHAIVRELRRSGWLVVAGVRNVASVSDLEPPVVACDVTDAAQVHAAISETITQYGRLDLLVNNAGVIEPIGPLATVDAQAWVNNLSVNLLGAFYACQAALPALIASQGVIINISSGAAGRPLEGWSAYCAAKAGLAMLCRSLALEYGPQGVSCFSLRPGVVDTGMQAVVRASGVNEVSKLRREDLADPAIPAAVVRWLAENRPTAMTGKELDVRDVADQLR